MATHETARRRRELVRDAGHPTISFLSVLAGTLVAFGALALIAAAAGAVGSQLGLSTDGVSSDEWRDAGIVGAVVGTLVLLVSFFFGGYTAGRMGRRAGAVHGLLVFGLGIVIVGVIALLAALWGDADTVRQSLQDEGVPTDTATWSDIGIGAAIAGVLGMLVGAVLGGLQGDRWHGRLIGAAVEHQHERALHENEVRDRRVGHDPTEIDLRRDDDQHVDDTAGDGDRGDEHVYDTERDRQVSLEEERERDRQRS